MNDISNMELIKLLIPVIAVQVGLFIYCLVDILRKGTQNLNRAIWIIIAATGTMGSIIYLILGRKRWNND
ncbi:MAG TPA: PLDc N-terminal domain-containing protein [Pseudobacteroides sp.]|uniref:PLDc N-terminal domain-containing protein n=1 Tax=Pseudobacteroides sp. TaxID=1968840 RepID=UPI002F93FF2D